MHVTDTLGWIATAAFTASYFFKRAEMLRRVQMGAALLWIAYGVLVGAAPVVVANLLVLAAALVAGFRSADRGMRTAELMPSAEFGVRKSRRIAGT